MNVTIRFFAQFRERFGPVHELAVPEGARLLDVLHEIAGRAHDGETALFAPDGRLREYVIVMKGTERIEHDRIERMAVQDGDTIAVFPPVAGG
jgi:molybdopterin synthase sulfur carrier subunit